MLIVYILLWESWNVLNLESAGMFNSKLSDLQFELNVALDTLALQLAT